MNFKTFFSVCVIVMKMIIIMMTMMMMIVMMTVMMIIMNMIVIDLSFVISLSRATMIGTQLMSHVCQTCC